MSEKIELFRHDCFPSGLFWCDYNLPVDLQEEIIECIMPFEKLNQNNYHGHGFTTYHTIQNFLEQEGLLSINQFITDMVQTVHNTVRLRGNVYIKDSWATVGEKYSWHGQHNHLPNLWSGVFYVQADDESSPIEFIDKNKDSNWPWHFKTEENQYTAKSIQCETKTGRLYIFPSYFDHSVNEYKGNGKRITIAFNCNANVEENV